MNKLLLISLVLLALVVVAQSQIAGGRQGGQQQVAQQEKAAARRAARVAAKQEKRKARRARIAAKKEAAARLAAQEQAAAEAYKNDKSFLDLGAKEALSERDQTQLLFNQQHSKDAQSVVDLSLGQAFNAGARGVASSNIGFEGFHNEALDAADEELASDGAALDAENNDAFEMLGFAQADQGVFGDSFFGRRK